MKRIHTWAVVVAMLTCGEAGCGGAVQHAPDAGASAPVTDAIPLRVHNNNVVNMNVFVAVHGMWKLMGFVAARSSASLEIGVLDWTGAPLRVLAMPVGGHGAARSDPLTVSPGQTVTFTIEPDLALSSAVVR